MRKERKESLTRSIPLLAVLISFLAAAAVTLFSPQIPGAFIGNAYPDMVEGSLAERTITAEKALSYVLEEETEALRDEARKKTPSVFTLDMQGTLVTLKRFDRLAELVNLHQDDFSNRFHLELQALMTGEPDRHMETFFSRRKAQAVELLPLAGEMLRNILYLGLFESEDIQGIDTITLESFSGAEKTLREFRAEEALTLNSIPGFIENSLSPLSPDQDELSFITSICLGLVEPNVRFDPILTEKARAAAAASVKPVTRSIEKGEEIIEQGEPVGPEAREKLQALASAGGGRDHQRLAGTYLLLILMFTLGWKFLSPFLHNQFRGLQNTIIILASWLIFYITAALLISFLPTGFLPLRSFFLPSALAGMIVTSMMGKRPAFFLILLAAFSLIPFTTIGKADLLFIIASGLIGIQVILISEKRIDLVRGALLITALHLVLVLLISLVLQQNISWTLLSFGIVTINAFISTMLNLVLLPILEHLTNAPTLFRLIELSDTSTPFFDRLLISAPGTYNHSMSVASLSESAARAIGANPLLARVGALYHDIGKIEQPEYFIENQTGNNKHDELKPSLSVAVIKSHVKLGIEKAKELKLPQEVVDIVGQHHGNGLIEYFYMEARKGEEENGKVIPEEYSYNGRPPTSREGAIVMLADTIEASTRTLKKPTIAKLEKFIWSRIMDKVSNRQLMNSNLTFSDLEKIKQSFVQILAGQFHSRIEYPRMEEGNTKNNEQH